MNLRPLATALLLALSPVTAFAHGDEWLVDFDAALLVAKEQEKDVLVTFTSSDIPSWPAKYGRERVLPCIRNPMTTGLNGDR